MLKHFVKAIFILAIAALSANLWAGIEVYDFDTPEQEARFKKLSDEMRCPLCLNANLSGSDAAIAADLRNEIYSQIMAGQSNEDIIEFMTIRYGDFINYRPPLNRGTFFLWFAPALLLLAGFFIVLRMLKANKNRENDLELSEEERLQLEGILSANHEPLDNKT